MATRATHPDIALGRDHGAARTTKVSALTSSCRVLATGRATHSIVPLSSATSMLPDSNLRSRMSISCHSMPGRASPCFSFICSIRMPEY
jgi:hypothetical protein